MKKLKFTFGNKKLSKIICTFSLPAGYTCPGAKICKSFCDKHTGKIIRLGEIPCYSARGECTYPAVRRARWHNFNLLKCAKTVEKIKDLIEKSLPAAPIYRIHVSGDYFSYPYFLAWVTVAKNHPDRLFYSYTKSLTLVQKYLKENGPLPLNFKLIASVGGRWDNLISILNLRSAVIVPKNYTGHLKVDKTDEVAYGEEVDLALLRH